MILLLIFPSDSWGTTPTLKRDVAKLLDVPKETMIALTECGVCSLAGYRTAPKFVFDAAEKSLKDMKERGLINSFTSAYE